MAHITERHQVSRLGLTDSAIALVMNMARWSLADLTLWPLPAYALTDLRPFTTISGRTPWPVSIPQFKQTPLRLFRQGFAMLLEPGVQVFLILFPAFTYSDEDEQEYQNDKSPVHPSWHTIQAASPLSNRLPDSTFL